MKVGYNVKKKYGFSTLYFESHPPPLLTQLLEPYYVIIYTFVDAWFPKYTASFDITTVSYVIVEWVHSKRYSTQKTYAKTNLESVKCVEVTLTACYLH